MHKHDTLHPHSIDRLARNLKDLQEIVELLVQKDIVVKFHKENLTFESLSANPLQTLMFQMLGAFAEFERTLIRECQREGLQAAKLRGQKLGAPSKLTVDQCEAIKAKVAQGMDKSKLSAEYGISRPTL